ncbi:hypothetical protein ACLBWS_17405 [Brucellaceae bacterium D45D]
MDVCRANTSVGRPGNEVVVHLAIRGGACDAIWADHAILDHDNAV